MSQGEEEQPRISDRRASAPQSESGEAATEGRSVDELGSQLNQEMEKAQSYFNSWQRAAADYQNFKRRVEQEREDVSRLANAVLIINLLPILDDMERALQSVDAHLAGLTWVDGVRLICRKFLGVLDAMGVSEIEADGATFDPTVHEAVMFGEGEDGKVISVVQKGYTLGGRVIRPAMVVVGQAKKQGDRENQ